MSGTVTLGQRLVLPDGHLSYDGHLNSYFPFSYVKKKLLSFPLEGDILHKHTTQKFSRRETEDPNLQDARLPAMAGPIRACRFFAFNHISQPNTVWMQTGCIWLSAPRASCSNWLTGTVPPSSYSGIWAWSYRSLAHSPQRLSQLGQVPGSHPLHCFLLLLALLLHLSPEVIPSSLDLAWLCFA